jgi:hypothetical protein
MEEDEEEEEEGEMDPAMVEKGKRLLDEQDEQEQTALQLQQQKIRNESLGITEMAKGLTIDKNVNGNGKDND